MRFTRWDQKSSTTETNALVTELALYHARQINDETAREHLVTSITSNDVLALCDYSVAYADVTVNDAVHIRQVLAFFTKRADLEIPGQDRRSNAVSTFIEAERLCAETNRLLEAEIQGNFSFLPGVAGCISAAAQKISQILGPVPALSAIKPRFGPGATTQIPKRNASARCKLGQTFACSEEFIRCLPEALEELQAWLPEGTAEDTYVSNADGFESRTVVVPVDIHHGRLAFVPKSCKTFRSVVVEPSLNVMFQAGIGDFIAKRLRRVGVDVRDQTRNQRLALEGSLSGALATLDLSSASDTIATGLIAQLLPFDWFELLDSFRSGTVLCDGYPIKMQKFSSMGNGFTFPLETLVFYALALTCVEEEDWSNVSVYGDDIIVPTYAYASLCQLLTCVGFKPNLAKSFGDGPFRESCGADYLKGINIRPSYVKDALSGFDVFRLHNQYVRRGDYDAAAILLRYIDKSLIKWGPDGYGDGHLIGDHHRRPHGRRNGWAGYTFETYTFVAKKDFKIFPGDRVYPSYSIYQGSSALKTFGPARAFSHVDLLKRVAADLREIESSPAHEYSRDGYLGVSIPGVRGYKSIKIYTLS